MGKKRFFIHEEIIGIFYHKFYIPNIENCNFILFVLRFLVRYGVGRLEIIIFIKLIYK